METLNSLPMLQMAQDPIVQLFLLLVQTLKLVDLSTLRDNASYRLVNLPKEYTRHLLRQDDSPPSGGPPSGGEEPEPDCEYMCFPHQGDNAACLTDCDTALTSCTDNDCSSDPTNNTCLNDCLWEWADSYIEYSYCDSCYDAETGTEDEACFEGCRPRDCYECESLAEDEMDTCYMYCEYGDHWYWEQECDYNCTIGCEGEGDEEVCIEVCWEEDCSNDNWFDMCEQDCQYDCEIDPQWYLGELSEKDLEKDKTIRECVEVCMDWYCYEDQGRGGGGGFLDMILNMVCSLFSFLEMFGIYFPGCEPGQAWW